MCAAEQHLQRISRSDGRFSVAPGVLQWPLSALRLTGSFSAVLV